MRASSLMRRLFWVSVGCAWAGMLILTAGTQRSDGRSAFGEHPLTIPAWGVLLTILGVGVLIDRRRMFPLYARGMPAGVFRTAIRRIVVLSGVMAGPPSPRLGGPANEIQPLPCCTHAHVSDVQVLARRFASSCVRGSRLYCSYW